MMVTGEKERTMTNAASSPTNGAAKPPEDRSVILEVDDLKAWYGNVLAVKNTTLQIPAQAITAIIGPSGCGKSTFIRCLNRLHEASNKGRVEGQVRLEGINIYDTGVDPVQLRRRIGMVFQKPSPFP